MPSGITPWPWVMRIFWQRVGLVVQAVVALPALRRVERDHVITDLNRGDARPGFHHDARTFMPEDSRERGLRDRRLRG